jgi:putative membrane protein
MRKNIVTLLFAGCACGVFAYAQSNSDLSSMDRSFVNKAAAGGLAEVQLGQLAQQKGSSQAVKDFGQRMVTDHSAANDKLKAIASSKGISLPTSLDAKDQALYDKLSGLSGTSFDKAYMQAMVKDHKMDIAEFQKESNAGKDQDIRSFASSTLPTLQTHLQLAHQAASKTGISATAEANHTPESALQK